MACSPIWAHHSLPYWLDTMAPPATRLPSCGVYAELYVPLCTVHTGRVFRPRGLVRRKSNCRDAGFGPGVHALADFPSQHRWALLSDGRESGGGASIAGECPLRSRPDAGPPFLWRRERMRDVYGVGGEARSSRETLCPRRGTGVTPTHPYIRPRVTECPLCAATRCCFWEHQRE